MCYNLIVFFLYWTLYWNVCVIILSRRNFYVEYISNFSSFGDMASSGTTLKMWGLRFSEVV